MYTPPTAPTTGSKEKPALQGVRNKQRKGVQKAQAKFEPQVFRDQLVKHLESAAPGDYDAVAQKLDALGGQLDYRKYEQQLFEILLAGGLLSPGGGYADDGPKSSFSVVGSAKEPVEVSDMKKVVEVFTKLLRRYKYLEKSFGEVSLRGILQYANRFSAVEQEKLAVATALFVQAGSAPASVVAVLKKDHLIKDNVAIRFFASFCKAYLASESLQHLASALRKASVTDFEQFLPNGKQNPQEFSAAFKEAGLGDVVDYYLAQRATEVKDETLTRLKEMAVDYTDYDDILAFLKSQHKRGFVADPDFIAIVWNGLFGAVDGSSAANRATVANDVKEMSPIFEEFCKKPSTEVALINTIQLWAFEKPALGPAFPQILKIMYSTDVLSDQSIIFWHTKGAKAQGKEKFLASTQKLVEFLQEQDDDEEDDSDEE